MSSEFVHREYGPLATAHILEHKNCALFASMGSGKTPIVLTALDTMYACGELSRPTLIVAPLRVAQSTWSDEAAKWNHLRGLEISPIVGTAKQRTDAYNRDAPVYTINYENLPWLKKQIGGRWPFGCVVADESIKLKGYRIKQGSSRAKALAAMAYSKTDKWINLSGAPAPNGLLDLWGQLWFLDGGKRLGRTFTAFQNRWFRQLPNRNGYGQIEPMPHAQAEIQDLIKDICLTIDIRDYYNIGQPIDVDIVVQLPSKARKYYTEMERKFFTEIEGSPIEAFTAASKSMKCLQLASGAIYTEEDDGSDTRPWTEVHDAKIQALESIIAEAAGYAVLVVYYFKSDLARLKKAFPEGRQFDKNPATKTAFLAGEFTVLFIHPKSAAHGVDGLQSVCHIVAFFSQDWNLDEYEQVTERIGCARQYQSKTGQKVIRYHIIAQDTLDEVVMERRKSKASVQDCLLNAMKRRKKK